MQKRSVAVAGLVVLVAAGVSGCGSAQTIPRKAAHLTIDGNSHATRPASCSQDQSYRTIDIRDQGGSVQAVVLLSGQKATPQWVKIRNIDGFTGSFWQGGVGDASADFNKTTYTITGSAYGINSSHPDTVVTTPFKISADC